MTITQIAGQRVESQECTEAPVEYALLAVVSIKIETEHL